MFEENLGDILLAAGVITSDDLTKALEYQKANGGRLGRALVQLGLLTEDEVTAALSRACGIPSISVADYAVNQDVIKLIPLEAAMEYQLLPLSRVGS
jgi:type IV pilus assembly protein PilB